MNSIFLIFGIFINFFDYSFTQNVYYETRYNGTINDSASQFFKVIHSAKRFDCVAQCTKELNCRIASFDKRNNLCQIYNKSFNIGTSSINSNLIIYRRKYARVGENCENINCDPVIQNVHCDGICKIYGIQRNKTISDITKHGFSLIYNQTYSHVTTDTLISSIRLGCLSQSQLCLGGYDGLNDIILLVACCDCLIITNNTVRNTTIFHNGAYWYNTISVSMGFAPSSVITQLVADVYDLNSLERLSWHLNSSGGWRLGTVTNLFNDIRYFKLIFKL